MFFFDEKTFSPFQIASLPHWEGAKYAGGSRPSCFICLPMTVVCCSFQDLVDLKRENIVGFPDFPTTTRLACWFATVFVPTYLVFFANICLFRDWHAWQFECNYYKIQPFNGFGWKRAGCPMGDGRYSLPKETIFCFPSEI